MQKYRLESAGGTGGDHWLSESPDSCGEWYRASEVDARIDKLEQALRELIRTAATVPGDACGGSRHPYAAQYLVSARAVEAARALMLT